MIEDGHVAEIGTYFDLLNRPDGKFRTLVEAQLTPGGLTLEDDEEIIRKD
jgi:hypothetical protein